MNTVHNTIYKLANSPSVFHPLPSPTKKSQQQAIHNPLFVLLAFGLAAILVTQLISLFGLMFHLDHYSLKDVRYLFAVKTVAIVSLLFILCEGMLSKQS